jgi:hypothetical protein
MLADDLEASHVITKVMDQMIKYLRQDYETIFKDGTSEMVVSGGKIHKYLGMTLDYTIRRQARISMLKYIDEILTAFAMAEPKGAGQNLVQPLITFSQSMKTARRSRLRRLCSFTSWWINVVCYQAS